MHHQIQPHDELQLPALLDKQRHAIGTIYFQSQAQSKVTIESVEPVVLTSRHTASRCRLSNGENVIITERRSVPLLPDVDGALQISDGELSWLWKSASNAFKDAKSIAAQRAFCNDIASTWKDCFLYRSELRDVNDNVTESGLRPPQIGALHAIGSHWSIHRTPATVVMPTGTGKTETMLAMQIAFQKSPLLVVVPWKPLRDQTRKKFCNLGLLRKLGVVPHEIHNPVVGVITKRPRTKADLSIFGQCNVIIATASSLTQGTGVEFADAVAEMVDTLVVDEAHHVSARTWSEFRDHFKSNRIIQFTATPYRQDGKLVDGEVIYNYPLCQAQKDGYFKAIKFQPVFELDDEDKDRAIAELALRTLDADRGGKGRLRHLLMARCENIERATKVHSLYCELAPNHNPLLIHSEASDAEQLVAQLREQESHIVVCVNMLGEGFDLPELKIAAIHDTHKSLGVLLQFIGRFTRSAGDNIGDATAIANIADADVSYALERLYSEDSDWNTLLSEFSSEAIKQHADLIEFLNDSKEIAREDDDDNAVISKQLLRPKFSVVVFKCDSFSPKRFHNAIAKSAIVHSVWLNEKMNTLYFITCTQPSVVWSRSKEVRDRQWDLFVLHHDAAQKLLFVHSSDKATLHEELAKAVGGKQIQLIKGDQVFRTLGNINRLMFQNIGVRKHGRRNLSYAMYTGADVKQALSLTEKSGSVKSNLTGTGFEAGHPVSIGCSIKGRVWSMDKGSIREFIKWCQPVGRKLLDDGIDTKAIIDNVLIPEEIDAFPDEIVVSIEWPVEYLREAEDRVLLTWGDREAPASDFEMTCELGSKPGDRFRFELRSDEVAFPFEMTIAGTRGFEVKSTDQPSPRIKLGKLNLNLDEYLSGYPPLIRFADLSELDGNLLVKPQETVELVIPEECFDVRSWDGVNVAHESIWKDGDERKDSIQGYVSNEMIRRGYTVVFDDDNRNEAADIVCFKEEPEFIRLALVHCKYASAADSNRVKDVVEVCSQAIRSAKWIWQFEKLVKHIFGREKRLATTTRPSRFLLGDIDGLRRILKAARFKQIRTEIAIAQPGISKEKRTVEQNRVMAAAHAFLKETVDVELDIMCRK